MGGLFKFLIGAALAGALPYAANQAFGLYEGFVTKRAIEARTAVGEAGQPMLSVEPVVNPVRRALIVSGDAPTAARTDIVARLNAIPGVAVVAWADDAANPPSGGQATLPSGPVVPLDDGTAAKTAPAPAPSAVPATPAGTVPLEQ